MINIFLWFPSKKNKGIRKICKSSKTMISTLFSSSLQSKINFYMKLFKKYFSNRDIFIGREMTKIHETFYRDSIKNFESSNKLLKVKLLFYQKKILILKKNLILTMIN